MKVLFISDTGLNLGLAMRCEGDGHDVKYLSATPCGQGILPAPSETQGDWADLILFDTNRHASRADTLREEGAKVLGPSRWSSLLAHDGTYRSQIITSLGFSINHVPQGTNFYVSAWFNGASFIASYASFVYRRFMAGGAGPDLACTGMLSSFHGLSRKTWDTFIRPLEKMLKKVNHRGPVHIHALVSGNSFCVKDINASFAHPLSLLLFENTSHSASSTLLALFDETSKPLKPTDAWACGLQLSVTPYPHGQLVGDRAIGMEGVVADNLNHLWLSNVSRREGKYYAQGAGLVGYVTARGSSEHECIRRMYRTVSNLKIPDLQYRNDVGRNVQNLVASLTQPGWLAT